MVRVWEWMRVCAASRNRGSTCWWQVGSARVAYFSSINVFLSPPTKSEYYHENGCSVLHNQPEFLPDSTEMWHSPRATFADVLSLKNQNNMFATERFAPSSRKILSPKKPACRSIVVCVHSKIFVRASKKKKFTVYVADFSVYTNILLADALETFTN